MTILALLIFVVSCVTAEEIKIGALLKSTGTDQLGKRAIDLWLDWVNGADNKLGFTVTFTETLYNESSLVADVEAMTRSNEVLIPPYTSGLTSAFVDAVHANFSGPILVWGGATDSIFTTNCANKNCFGTLSVASHYMVGALTAVMAKSVRELTVGLIQNDNGFSRAVCADARDFIAKTYGVTAVNNASLQVVAGGGASNSHDEINALLEQMPDVVLVCGHSGDVEHVVMAISAHNHRPHAIIATNSITPAAQTVFTDAGHADLLNCLIMPTQWGESAATDPNVGWNSAAFTSAFGTDVSYHAASMAGALLALTQALALGDAGTRKDNLVSLMKRVDIESFYGKIAFNADGSIKKPMYFQQHQGHHAPVFTNLYGALKDDLEMCHGWGSPMTCGAFRSFYNSQECCGNPSKEIDMVQLR